MKIRVATRDDVLTLVNLWREMMEYHAGMHPDFRMADDADEVIEESFLRLIKDSEGSLIVAEEDGELVGMLTAIVKEGQRFTATRKSGYFKDVVIRESHRNRGIGKELGKAGIKFLKFQDVDYIDLITGSENEISNGFWESLGFKETLIIRTMEL